LCFGGEEEKKMEMCRDDNECGEDREVEVLGL